MFNAKKIINKKLLQTIHAMLPKDRPLVTPNRTYVRTGPYSYSFTEGDFRDATPEQLQKMFDDAVKKDPYNKL